MDYEKKTVGFLVEDLANRYGDRPFLLFRDQSISYGEVNEKSNQVARGFLDMGVKKGDKVVVIMHNCPEILYVWFGLAKIGAVEVPLNVAHRGEVLEYMINHSDAQTLVVADSLLDRVTFVQDKLTNIKQVVVFSETTYDTSASPLRFPTHDFGRLMDNPGSAPEASVNYWDPASIIYTSGTTGLSKGAVHCHNFQLLCAQDLVPYLTYTEDDIVFSPLPLFHVNAKYFSTMVVMMVGGKYAIGERFSARKFWQDIKKYQATAFHFLGGVASIIYNQPPREDDGDNTVRIAWGGPVPPNIFKDFEKRFNLTINSRYFGMTETGMIIRASCDDPNFSSCGKNTEGYEVKLLDSQGDEVGVDEIGEICVRPLRPHSFMSGYYKRPEATLEAMEGYWFHTGDLSKKDKDGYFYFVDRKKDALRRRGENISSFEIERVVVSHPAVRECAVVDVPSELGGVGEGEVKAVMVLQEGATLKPEELIDYCVPRMAYFMVPRFLQFKETLPKTPTERVEKYKLRKEGVTPDTWDREKTGYKLKK